MNTILKKRFGISEMSERKEAISAIAKKFGLSHIISEILVGRGFDTADKVQRFLNPSTDDFADPFDLTGMDECVKRIKAACENREKIVVYGDYDADGICSAAMLTKFLSDNGADVVPYIPSRHHDGYGISDRAINMIIEEIIPDLILTCDCGISARKEIDTILDCGIDVIVTDHHEPPAELPDCVIINPKVRPQKYPIDNLCGAGVALKVIQAVAGIDEALKYVDLAAVATIADLVPLVDENRAIVSLGLKRINSNNCNAGIKAFLSDLEFESTVTAQDVAYKIAPRINAAGRMGDAYRSLEVLLAENMQDVLGIVTQINIDNEKRKSVCAALYKQAVAQIRQNDYSSTMPIILTHPDWEKGLTSIVAAQIANEYNRPSFLLVKHGALYKGTARSVEDINIYNVLASVSDLLTDFGGHSQAAGFSIVPENLDAFKTRVNDYIHKNFTYKSFLPCSQYDCNITADDIQMPLARELGMLEPMGIGNPKPIFCLNMRGLDASVMKNKNNHIVIKLPKININAFNFGNYYNVMQTNSDFKLGVEIQVNTFNNHEYLGATLKYLDYDFFGSINNTDSLTLSYYNCLGSYFSDPLELDTMTHSEFVKIINSDQKFGTLVVAYSYQTYSEAMRRYPGLCEFSHSLFNRESSVNYNRVVLSPDSSFDANGYSRIILLDRPFFEDKLNFSFSGLSKLYIFEDYNTLKTVKIAPNREKFVECYKKFIAAKEQVYGATNIVNFIIAMSNDMNERIALIACYNILKELEILEWDSVGGTIHINNSVKRELNESTLYQYFQEIS